MVIYNKVSALKNKSALNDRGCIMQFNGTTIAISSLFSKTFEIMNTLKYNITTNVSAHYSLKTAYLSCCGLKKSNSAELLSDFRTRKTIIN